MSTVGDCMRQGFKKLQEDGINCTLEWNQGNHFHEPEKRMAKASHEKPVKARKSFTKKEQIRIFMRDGFIDRYSGDRLVFPGVLCILSHIMPDVFPYQENWKTDECHQGWWKLFPSIDHVVPLAFGGTNDDANLVCTSMKRNLSKSTSTLEEIGWKLCPPGKLSDWDGLLVWFMSYVPKHPELLENVAIKRWYKICVELDVDKQLPKNK